MSAVAAGHSIVAGGCTTGPGPSNSGGNCAGGLPGLGTGGCFDPGPSLGDTLGNLGQQALQNLASQMLDKVLAVKDSDPMALAVAKHLASQFGMDALTALQNPAEFMKKMDLLFNGVKSSASMPAAQTISRQGASFVFVNGLPWAHIGDKMIMTNPSDEGPLLQGNPTILVNQIPASGEDHIAIGIHFGTVAVPAMVSTNVFLGPEVVSVPPPGSDSSSDSGNSQSGSGSPGEPSRQQSSKQNPDDAEAEKQEDTGGGQKGAQGDSDSADSSNETSSGDASSEARKSGNSDKSLMKGAKEGAKAAKTAEKHWAQADLDARVEADTQNLDDAKKRATSAHASADGQTRVADAAERERLTSNSSGAETTRDVGEGQRTTDASEAERYRESRLRDAARSADADAKAASQSLENSKTAQEAGPQTARYKFLDKVGRVLGTASDVADLISADKQRQILVAKGQKREALELTGKTVGKIALGAGGAVVTGLLVGATAPVWVAIGAGAGIGWGLGKLGEKIGGLIGGGAADAAGIEDASRSP